MTSTMAAPDVLALGVFTSYFALILYLFDVIVRDLATSYRDSKSRNTNHLRPAAFIALAVASFGHTWYYMLNYMTWSFARYHQLHQALQGTTFERVASWLRNTSLFEEAWASVCKKPMNWWWSEQLCLFTVGAWTVFLAVEGKRHRIKHVWAYMLLGQVVAISVASNLFYTSLLLSQSSTSQDLKKWKASPSLWISVLLSLATVVISPFTNDRTFLPNLLAMHAFLLVPLLLDATALSPAEARPSFSLDVAIVYRLIYSISAAIRVRTIVAAVKELQQAQPTLSISLDISFAVAKSAWKILHSHPAQSSIGWDVVWTSISFIVWTTLRPSDPTEAPRFWNVGYLLLTTPAASIGVSAPHVLRPREDESLDPVETKRE